MPTVEMTARWIERLKPPEKDRVDYFDAKLTGLGLRVSSTGRMSWFVAYRVKGDPKWRRLTLEPYPVLSLADAREKARHALAEAARGENPAEEKQEARTAPTFAALAQEFMERYSKAEKRSWKEDERILNHDLLPAWGRLKAMDIKKRDVLRLLDAIKDRGAPIQANRTLALARKIYNFGIKRDLVEANPCSQVGQVAPENQRDRVLKEDEIRAVWLAFEKQEQLMQSMFKLRFLTAQRGGEVASIAWRDIDLATGWWTIPKERAKNKLAHRVPLSPEALAILMQLRERTGQGEWVFPSPKKKGYPIENVQKAAERVQEASGVDFVMHDLRRTAASYMTGMGINRLVVSKVLNHVEAGVTRVYDRHSYDAEKRQALDAWASRLMSIVSKQDASDGL